MVAFAVALVVAIKAAAAQGSRPPHPDPWFGIDKVKHFFMSAFINSVSYSALQAARVNHRSAMAGAIGITMAAGLAREIHDMRVPGNTAAGAALTSHTIR